TDRLTIAVISGGCSGLEEVRKGLVYLEWLRWVVELGKVLAVKLVRRSELRYCSYQQLVRSKFLDVWHGLGVAWFSSIAIQLELEYLQSKCESWIAGSISWKLGLGIVDVVSNGGSYHSRLKNGAKFQYILAAAWIKTEVQSVGSECDSGYGSNCHNTCNCYQMRGLELRVG
ncbi:MAG: hypothetical protein EZS28_044861, partial [Streblomastix strix]